MDSFIAKPFDPGIDKGFHNFYWTIPIAHKISHFKLELNVTPTIMTAEFIAQRMRFFHLRKFVTQSAGPRHPRSLWIDA